MYCAQPRAPHEDAIKVEQLWAVVARTTAALESNPEDEEAFRTRAAAHKALGNTEEIDDLVRLVTKRPDLTDIRKTLSSARSRARARMQTLQDHFASQPITQMRLDYGAFPNIVDTVIGYLPFRTRLACRTLSRGMRDKIDTSRRHIEVRRVVDPSESTGTEQLAWAYPPCGRNKPSPLTPPVPPVTVDALDIVDTIDNATLRSLQDLRGLRTVRLHSCYQLCSPEGYDIGQEIDIDISQYRATKVVVFPRTCVKDGWTREADLRLPHRVEKVVYHIKFNAHERAQRLQLDSHERAQVPHMLPVPTSKSPHYVVIVSNARGEVEEPDRWDVCSALVDTVISIGQRSRGELPYVTMVNCEVILPMTTYPSEMVPPDREHYETRDDLLYAIQYHFCRTAEYIEDYSEPLPFDPQLFQSRIQILTRAEYRDTLEDGEWEEETLYLTGAS